MFIAGGASGIGHATALAFAREGADVALTYHKQSAEPTARRVEDLGRRALIVKCDVSHDEVRGAIDETIRTFGRLDYAFNNAGTEEKISTRLTLQSKNGIASLPPISEECFCA